MSAPSSKSIHLSSALDMSEETMVSKRQGIVSILEADTERVPAKAASLRRTLSADMSSKKWLSQHGFSPLKKIASSKEFPVSIIDSSSEEGEEETEAPSQFDIWTSIQEENKKKELEKPGQFDIWSSIISQKEDSSKSLSPPYIHPLVKRSASSLSEKSLQICTESLGSETGSDGFSSYPPSESGDMEEDKEEDQGLLQQQKQEKPLVPQLTCFDEEPRILKYNYDVVGRKSPEYRSFPPPIPSLSRKDGAAVHMKTRRDNGRLVLEAVSVPLQNNFLAQRQDGRLVLTFANTTPSKTESEVDEVMNVEEEAEEVEELEEVFESFEEEEDTVSEIDIDEEEEEEEAEVEGVEDRYSEMEQAPKLPSGAMNVHRLAVMMNKPVWLANRNPTWSKNFDEIVKFGEERDEKVEPTTTPPPLAQSLPPRPPVSSLIPSQPSTAGAAAAASLNAYNHYWRRPNQPISKAAADQVLNPLAQQSPPVKNNSHKQLILSKANDQQQGLELRGNKVIFGCKEPRRSLLFWEPYCIATS
ncbi:hypothetical protein PTKIN_Ptkin11bG0068100 [Pterospermum kingtungense]